MLIVESDNFVLESHEKPEIGRTDGGHLVINPKVSVQDRTELSPQLVVELALLTNVAGIAMKTGLAEQGIILGRINYQDNGNWKPKLHIHLYGRAIDSTYQIYGEPIITARRIEDKIIQEPLSTADCKAIRSKALLHGANPGYENLSLR